VSWRQIEHGIRSDAFTMDNPAAQIASVTPVCLPRRGT
jgi:hypothetical protein